MFSKRKHVHDRARRDIGAVVEILIDLLDSIDGDADFEPDEDREDDGDQNDAEVPRRDRVPPRRIRRPLGPT